MRLDAVRAFEEKLDRGGSFHPLGLPFRRIAEAFDLQRHFPGDPQAFTGGDQDFQPGGGLEHLFHQFGALDDVLEVVHEQEHLLFLKMVQKLGPGVFGAVKEKFNGPRDAPHQ